MKTARVFVIYLLAVAVPLPSWGAVFMPCMATERAAIAQTGHEAHHESGGEHAGHHQQDAQQPAATDCPCCDGCAEACPFTGCSSTAILSSSDGQAFHFTGQAFVPLKTGFCPDPLPRPLFRPPIPKA